MAQSITLDDLLRQARMTRRLGPFAGILRLYPGYVSLDPDAETLVRIEGMISAMSPEERQNPDLVVEGDRISGIARESNESESNVRKFLHQFGVMRELQGAA